MAKLETEEALIQAALAALRPFVRRLLRRGVSFGRFEKRLRELFVEVAENDIASSDGRQTDSRISALTGLNRKEVRRIRHEGERGPAPRSFSRNLAAALIGRWMNDPATTGSTGRPRAIPYDADKGPSFVRLAEKTTNDLGPRALLQVLIDSGTAELRKDGKVALKRNAYVPEKGRPEALAMLADDPPELIESMLVNVLGEEGAPRLQQKLAYDNLGSDGMERLKSRLRREAQRFLDHANRALSKHDRDRNAKAPGGRRTYAGIGVYYFETEMDEEDRLESPQSKRRPNQEESK